jgi:protein-S-isoprenylcysteine O-methyltransferase Ste14
MPASIRHSLIALGVTFVLVGAYYRIQSQRSGERLDRTREGWPILIGLRLAGLVTLGVSMFWFGKPEALEWASFSVNAPARWIGVAGFAVSIAWLLWMFKTLGRNLTDTVVVRRDAYFVDYGPYRFVRNPMYTGVLMAGLSFGLACGMWPLPLGSTIVFGLFVLRTRNEERYLIDRFGDQYLDNMRRVGRFFPKFRS